MQKINFFKWLKYMLKALFSCCVSGNTWKSGGSSTEAVSEFLQDVGNYKSLQFLFRKRGFMFVCFTLTETWDWGLHLFSCFCLGLVGAILITIRTVLSENCFCKMYILQKYISFILKPFSITLWLQK